jgi:glc operon protein GlcG
MPLTLAEANQIVAGVIAEAEEHHVHISVAVCDRWGHLIALNRMDGAYATVNEGSIGKAIVSAATGLPSGQVEGIVNHPTAGIVVAQGAPVRRVRGALPIIRNDVIEGGCGVNGAPSSEQDEECARAGISRLLAAAVAARQ